MFFVTIQLTWSAQVAVDQSPARVYPVLSLAQDPNRAATESARDRDWDQEGHVVTLVECAAFQFCLVIVESYILFGLLTDNRCGQTRQPQFLLEMSAQFDDHI